MELLVNTDAFDTCIDTLRRCERVIDSVRSTVVAERGAMSDRVMRSSGALWQLQEAVDRLSRNKNNVKSMYLVSINVQRQYRNMENRNVRLADGVAIPEDSSDADIFENATGSVLVSPVVGPDSSFDHLSYIWQALSQAGIIGSILGTLGSTLTGGDSDDVSDNLMEFVENFGEAFGGSEPSFSWQNLLGLDDYNFADDYNLRFGNGQSVGENVAVGARWAGFILTGLFNGIDNLTGDREGENNLTGRAIAETIGETIADIGVDAGVAFLVSAAAASCGVALPAVVVGGAVVAVGWASDYICETFLGKDLSETVSDFVLDTAEGVWDGVTQAYDAVTDFAENACEFIGDAAETAWDTISGWCKVFA